MNQAFDQMLGSCVRRELRPQGRRKLEQGKAEALETTDKSPKNVTVTMPPCNKATARETS